MLFNSFDFLIFFAVVYAFYVVLPFRGQNAMLLVASFIFYGWWDWRFLFLFTTSIVTSWLAARSVENALTIRQKKTWIVVCLVINLGILGFFKYYNFFIDSLSALFESLSVPVPLPVLAITLPVGISFYTFQAIAYPIDIYRGHVCKTSSLLEYALYISFFPHLVAGPIQRPGTLLVQIQAPRTLTLQRIYDGSFFIFWGLFLKVFAADNLAKLVNPVFGAPGPYDAETVLIAVLAFSMQIFCDFAAYSYMAVGLAKYMGFELIQNFDSPYVAVNPSDFWRRWHISLSTWLRDYLYVPLGGNRHGELKTYRNLMLTMLLGGLWHGAAWNFVLWGGYHGLLLVMHRLCQPFLPKREQPRPAIVAAPWYALRAIFFFVFIAYGWMLFRATSLDQISQMTRALLTWSSVGDTSMVDPWKQLLFYSLLPLVMQVLQFVQNSPGAALRWPALVRALFYVVCFYLLLIYGVSGRENFIYFQF